MKSLVWHTEKRKINDLIPTEKNPRKMTEKQERELRESLEKFNLVDIPAINTDNRIISGHQRLRILQLLGRGEEEVDVRVPNRNLTEGEHKEYLLRANKNTGEWDLELLQGFDEDLLADIGWSSEEIDEIFRIEPDEDDFNAGVEYEKITEPKTKLGNVYELGDHRLMCGDATKKEDVEMLMGGVSADVVFTDPPYNMNYESKAKGGIIGDNIEEEEFIAFSIEFMIRMKEAMKSGGVYYICSGYQSYIPFMYAIKQAGLEFANPIIWVKNSIGMGMGDYRAKHEMILRARNKKRKATPIMYGYNKGKHYFIDSREEADVWEVSRRATNTMVHPTQKPLELIGRAIRNSSKREEVVLDLFGGSGSTLIASEKNGRVCYTMELDPKYCDVIVARWEHLTGQKAKLIKE